MFSTLSEKKNIDGNAVSKSYPLINILLNYPHYACFGEIDDANVTLVGNFKLLFYECFSFLNVNMSLE